jgi:hypothetical protein
VSSARFSDRGKGAGMLRQAHKDRSGSAGPALTEGLGIEAYEFNQ